MYTIGRLASRFNLSRSTLLYYDSIGLLKPSFRTENRYRQYSEDDARRLEEICRCRQAGLPLDEIRNVLDSREDNLKRALEKRLDDLNRDIKRLREQQRFILGILKTRSSYRHVKVMNVKTWKSLLKASGFSEEDMQQWHVEFERLDSEKHQEFLEFLCIPDSDIDRIRSWAREQSTA